MQRRVLMQGTAAGLVAFGLNGQGNRQATAGQKQPATSPYADLEPRWRKLDEQIRSWWEKDIGKADEAEVRADKSKTLLFLPLPFTTAAGNGSAYPDLYCWDTQFINQALLLHGQRAMVMNNVRNQLSLIDRVGFIPNGNRSFYLTRSQTPLLWWSVEALVATGTGGKDLALAMEAFPRLEREFNDYWRAPHLTPTGLSRAFDLGDPSLRPELASEAETGLDFNPTFGGDVRNCNPLIINAALIRYAQSLSNLAKLLGLRDKANKYDAEAKRLASLVDKYCWDEEQGYYFDYDFVQGKRLPFWSVVGYWMMWAGVPNKARAKRMVANLGKFLASGGMTVTAEEYPSPHKEYARLQWNHPSAWAPMQIVAMEALDRYGYKAEAQDVAGHFLRNQLDTWDATGSLWERYDAVIGGQDKKKERAVAFSFHGWSSAAVALLGNRLFEKGARK
jgi:alpha,alpha-trehalase